MKIIRRTNVVVKTERVLIVRGQDSNRESVFCPRCGEPMTNARETAQTLGASVREVYKMVEAEKIHFFETERHDGWMCLRSIKDKTGFLT